MTDDWPPLPSGWGLSAWASFSHLMFQIQQIEGRYRDAVLEGDDEALVLAWTLGRLYYALGFEDRERLLDRP